MVDRDADAGGRVTDSQAGSCTAPADDAFTAWREAVVHRVSPSWLQAAVAAERWTIHAHAARPLPLSYVSQVACALIVFTSPVVRPAHTAPPAGETGTVGERTQDGGLRVVPLLSLLQQSDGIVARNEAVADRSSPR